VKENVAGDRDDGDTDHNTKFVQDLLLAQKRDRPAYCFQHLDLEYASTTDGGRANLDTAIAALSPGPAVVARFRQKWNSVRGNKTRSFNILGRIQ
jgi:hypothetical protein